MTLDNEWSATKLSTFHTCIRKFRYRYVDGLGEPATQHQEYGKGVHRGLEAWLLHHHEGADERLAAALAAIDLSHPIDAAKARAVLLGYEVRWGSVRWRVLAVEVPFRYELDGKFIPGIIDAIIQDEIDGRVFVVEHKNTVADASPGSSYWEVLSLDRQLNIYVDGAAMLGYDIAGVIYDVLGRPKHDLLLTTPEEKRKYTQPTKGKGCKNCGGRAGGKSGPLPGNGYYIEDNVNVVCGECGGTGWSVEPKPSKLYEGQRETSETVTDFEARVCAAIAESPDTFYQRGTVVRTDDELPKMRADLLETIRLAKLCEVLDMWPRGNAQTACRSFGSVCHFLPLCNSSADLTDARFQRRARDEQPAPVTTL